MCVCLSGKDENVLILPIMGCFCLKVTHRRCFFLSFTHTKLRLFQVYTHKILKVAVLPTKSVFVWMLSTEKCFASTVPTEKRDCLSVPTKECFFEKEPTEQQKVLEATHVWIKATKERKKLRVFIKGAQRFRASLLLHTTCNRSWCNWRASCDKYKKKRGGITPSRKQMVIYFVRLPDLRRAA